MLLIRHNQTYNPAFKIKASRALATNELQYQQKSSQKSFISEMRILRPRLFRVKILKRILTVPQRSIQC